ncbi:hypothetical protein GIB67_010563 [Kingdonia uniflora]|uniref:AAA+ ATPase domain-containing protein n=1 Tax=Kingdonia uniflora TaxID=39325 RepID=A0A7J7MAW0_9MAGN|nr:hypothetical protein GIB67_010563 [Kingdonia uniflora]
MEIASGPVTEIVKCAAVPASRQICYLLHYKRNVHDLRDKVNDLAKVQHDVQHKVDLALSNGQVIHQIVDGWLLKVETLRNEASRLDAEVEEIASCFKGSVSARYRLGREAKKKIEPVIELLKEGANLMNNPSVSDPAPLPDMPIGPFEVLPSRHSTKKQIIEKLSHDEVGLVGVYGMGGVGKTTLMKEVWTNVLEMKLFDEVVMITVSQKRIIKGIQTEIAEKLGMKLEEESLTTRAARLRQRIKQVKNILIILDDIWEYLALADIGIAHGEDRGGCKVVFTTRSLEVCSSMGTRDNIEVQVLSEPDSLELFRRSVGDIVKCNSLQEISKEIVGQCKGLPLAIVALAKALRDKDQGLWDVALQRLKKSIVDGDSPVMSSVRLSYDYLQSKETKLCFLLCSLYPEDYEISMNELQMYAMGEEVLGEVDTLKEARGQLLRVVDKLLSSCLLLKGNSDSSKVMMHDVVRDVSISMGSEESNGFIVKAGMGLQEWPKMKKMGNCLRMSLMNNALRDIPDQLDCPQLLTLSLAGNRRLLKIPDGFFNGMKSLATLDLSYTRISLLPQTLSNFPNLVSLNLERCHYLVDISLIGSLRNLEILNLYDCNIKCLPEEFILLTKLKLLNLSGNRNLKTIAPNAISSFSRLEELYMINTFKDWEIKGRGDGNNASLAELASLTRLSTLHLLVNDDSLVYKDPPFHWKNITKFKISVRGVWFWEKYSSKNCLHVSIHDYKAVAEWVRVLWGRTDELRLIECKSLVNVVPLLHLGFSDLKILELNRCQEMEYVIHVEELCTEAIFAGLESLELKDLSDLRAICNGPLQKGSLERLESLEVGDCLELVNVLPRELLVKVRHLESIHVRGCSKVEELFNSEGLEEEEGHASTTSMFPRLRRIKLYYLSSLTAIWKGFIPLGSLQNLKEVLISNCKSLRYPFSLVMAQTLQQLELLYLSNCNEMVKILGSEEEEEISQTATLPIFSNLRSIEIENCKILKYIFSMRIVRGLMQLERLKVSHCPQIMNLWGSEEEEKIVQTSATICVPQPPIFSNLILLQIVECDSLKCLFSMRVARGLLQLKNLIVTYCSQMKELIEECQEEEDTTAVLPRLQTLHLWNLPNLTSFYQHSSILLSLVSLEELNIRSCKKLKRLPLGPHSAPKLTKFVTEVDWFEELEWEDQSIKARLQSLRTDDLEDFVRESVASEIKCKSLENVAPLLHLEFSDLKTLKLDWCPEMEYVIHVEELCTEAMLAGLESLELKDLSDLRAICNGPLQKGSLERLESREVGNCRELVNVLPRELLVKVRHLESIHVHWCSKVEELFNSEGLEEEEGHASTTSMFPRLRRIELYYLSSLTAIWKGFIPLGSLQNLKEVLISNCKSLRYPFSLVMAQTLQQLELLYLNNCNEMVKILGSEEEEEISQTATWPT